MTRYPARRRGPAWVGAVVIAAVLALLTTASPAMAGSYATLSGSGSSWASVALSQWAMDEQPIGLTVNFNPDGSASGRGDYMQGSQVDFAASDPPFRSGNDALGGTGAETPSWGYSYVPDVGGGTAFMYHVTVAGHLVSNLRLSGETITKIFTGVITNWDDPAITKDYGAQLPNEPIIPVVRSDGSGATFFLTRWMSHVYPSLWNAFCQRVNSGIKLPCPQTEFYPQQFGSVKAENGSNNVSTYITSSYGEGSIGYDEYAYALNANWPVVKMENPGGYYVLPSASNVAVALTQAQINENQNSPDFLQQNLDSVYTYTDPRSYPLSSYSYLIVPNGTKNPPIFNAAEGRSLSTFINFYLCQGQQQASQLGYSPLPINLVTGAFQQVNKIPGTVGAPNINNYGACNNPTFTQGGQDILLKQAAYPSKCDKVGAPLSCSSGGTTPTSRGTNGRKSGKTANPTSTTTAGTGAGPSAGGSGTGTGSGSGVAQSANITGSVINIPGNGADRILLAVITAIGVAAAVAAPPSVAAYLRRRRGGTQ